MSNSKSFFVVSLIAVMAINPAFSDSVATREWVKAQVYDKYIEPQGVALNTINNRLATDVRDKIYNYDTDKNSPTYRQVLDPLNTESQTAFSGINEVLEKVDGNNGTQGSAVQLETTAKNAYGAINELKGEIDTKVSTTELNNTLGNYYNKDEVDTALSNYTPEEVKTVYDKGTDSRRYVSIVDSFNEEEFREDYLD